MLIWTCAKRVFWDHDIGSNKSAMQTVGADPSRSSKIHLFSKMVETCEPLMGF